MTRRRGSISRGFRVPGPSVAALCALAVALVLAGCALAASSPVDLKSPQPKPPQGAAHPVHGSIAPERIVIIGDSLSTGYGTSPEEAWPRLLRHELHAASVPAKITNEAQNGAGYLTLGEEDATFASQISESVNASTDVVVLFGSDNDAGQDPAELRAALTDALEEITTLAPHARQIMIGPLTGFDALESDVTTIRDQERAAARDAGAEFIDPVAEQWVAGPDSPLLGPDGEHPSSGGQQFLAEKIRTVLDQHRVSSTG
ncbi:SGNH/GDSL hydrolase family protein [Paenarthrobacter sp. GOM3]|uniref:SGNH/GDSL hydrolase family protein n=1 Tax=Paenarthrobacter sp. GOM3 TaxID=2782567 RepID=UPI00295A5CDC|nr:SGNH/GDSL hydrolase family protein [Paenarthrobacter sp. GOM3]WOH19139.1 SGNH/GDSL hydrolase family protein [Paenarthrobacter sp. GOM3]